RGPEATAALRALFAAAQNDVTTLPPSAHAITFLDDGRVRVEGAICLRARGRKSDAARAPLPDELRAVTEERRQNPLYELVAVAKSAGARAPVLLALSIVLATCGAVVEALLLRGLFDIGRDLGDLPQRIGAAAAMLAWAVALTLLELPLRSEVRRL